MTKRKRKPAVKAGVYVPVEELRPGDIVQIEWLDTYQQTSLTPEQIADLDDENPTIVWGCVLRHTKMSVIIATELGHLDASNTDIEQIPHAMVQRAKVLDRIKVWS
jgi:hypothetical protein